MQQIPSFFRSTTNSNVSDFDVTVREISPSQETRDSDSIRLSLDLLWQI